jgi:FlaG/FlaF family flagellin (archaellin)
MKGKGESSRAVSTVVGVVLMVAVAVVLAAVVGGFVTGIGEEVEENARAAVDADIDTAEDEISMSVTTLDNSDYVLIRGAEGFKATGGNVSGVEVGGSGNGDFVYMSSTGARVVLSNSSGSGTLRVVAVKGRGPEFSTGTGSSGDAVALTSGNPPDTAVATVVQRIDYDFT